MSDKSTSNVHDHQSSPQPNASQPRSSRGANPWQQIIEEQIARVGTFYEEAARLEHQGFDRLNAQVDEMTKLTKESFAYANQLSAEWRRLALEATRRTADLFSTRV